MAGGLYTVNALRYFTKPVTRQQLFEVLDLVYAQTGALAGEYFAAKSGGKQLFLPLREITYFEIQGHRLLLHRVGQAEPLTIRMRLLDVEAQLKDKTFLCTHRSFLVNLIYIRTFENDKMELADGTEIPVSRSYAERVRAAMYRYFQGGKNHIGVDDF